MYDNYINNSKFHEIRSLIHEYSDYSENYNGPTLENISEKAYMYFQDGKLSSSQYDNLCNLIDDLEV